LRAPIACQWSLACPRRPGLLSGPTATRIPLRSRWGAVPPNRRHGGRGSPGVAGGAGRKKGMTNELGRPCARSVSFPLCIGNIEEM